jgi:hypothetical protein
MSPKKITDADKLEMVARYRQTRDTAAALAVRYGVSNSTIGRILKNSIPEDEYELLIQQKRGVKNSIPEDECDELPIQQKRGANSSSDDEENVELIAEATSQSDITLDSNILAERIESDRKSAATASSDLRSDAAILAETVAPSAPIELHMEEKSSIRSTPTPDLLDSQAPEQSSSKRLVRRRSSTRIEDSTPSAPKLTPSDRPNVAEFVQTSLFADPLPTPAETPPPVINVEKRTIQPPILSVGASRVEPASELIDEIAIDDDSEEEPEDVNALAAMFGEEIADGDDDDDDDDDWDEEPATVDRSSDRDLLLTGNNTYLQVTPLSQATLPRTCYIAIDKFAEPVVRPLKDFAELGQIPAEEIQQRTLPVFDNHRIAKRFSNQRTQRVIKIPDSRVFQKTIAHMRSKGITRLLVDGNIYSLN